MGAVAKQTRGEELGRGMMVLFELSMERAFTFHCHEC